MTIASHAIGPGFDSRLVYFLAFFATFFSKTLFCFLSIQMIGMWFIDPLLMLEFKATINNIAVNLYCTRVVIVVIANCREFSFCSNLILHSYSLLFSYIVESPSVAIGVIGYSGTTTESYCEVLGYDTGSLGVSMANYLIPT
jgi:hypothetical protein